MFSEEIDPFDSILVIASLGAMLTFIAVALPLLNRTEKREHTTNVIEKKRKIFSIKPKNRSIIKKNFKKEVSMSTRIWFFFTVQKRFGAWVKRYVTRCCRLVSVIRKLHDFIW